MIGYKSLLLLLLNVYDLLAFKVLVYNPVYASSHVMFADKITQTLRQAGHTVIQYCPVQNENVNLKKLDHKDNWIRMPKNVEINESIFDRMADAMWETYGLSVQELILQFNNAGTHFAKHCNDQLEDNEFMDRLGKENFDFALTEYQDICGLGIFEKIGIKKFAGFSPLPVMNHISEAFGVPSMSSFVPDLITPSFPEIRFKMRFRNFYSSTIVGTVSKFTFFGHVEKVIREKVNPNFNTLQKFALASYLFISSDVIFDFPRVNSAKFIHIGGLGISNSKPLEKKFQQILDNSNQGVILVSFGTIALSHKMPAKLKQAFLEAFSQFPEITFLWKYEEPKDNIAKGYKNVITDVWVPQRDLFDHPKFIGFVTHGGLNSITEAAYGGSPVLSIGLFGDQERNGKVCEYRGIGISVDKSTLNKEVLVEKLSELINNEKYRKNAKEMAQMLKSKPHSAEEMLVKHVEYATKFDIHEKLDMHGRKLSFIQLHNLDIIVFSILVVLLALLTIFISFKRILSIVFRITKRKID